MYVYVHMLLHFMICVYIFILCCTQKEKERERERERESKLRRRRGEQAVGLHGELLQLGLTADVALTSPFPQKKAVLVVDWDLGLPN